MKGIGALVVAVGILALPATAGATTITVNTTIDTWMSNACSLREAISAVNAPGSQVGDCTLASAGADTLVLGAGDYRLSLQGADETANQTGDLNVLGTVNGLTIAGAGEGATSIDATGLGDRVLNIATGATASLRDLTVTGGSAPSGQNGATGANSSIGNGLPGGDGGAGENGGGILNAGTLTLEHVAVTDSLAGPGGNGGNGGASTSSSGNGGAGGNGGSGGDGGGIYNSGTLTVTDSTISANSAGNRFLGGSDSAGGRGGSSTNGTGGAGGQGGTGGFGGGIYNTGALTMTGSTIDDNYSGFGGWGQNAGYGLPGGPGGSGANGGDGGGVSSWGGSVSIANSTIADNATENGGAGGNGGSTNNDLQYGGNGGNGGYGGSGGGVQIDEPSRPLEVLNTTIAGNVVGAGDLGGNGANVGGLQGSNGTAGSPGNGGGIEDSDFPFPPISAEVVLQNTLVGSNAGGNCDVAPPLIADGGHNLSFGDDSCPGTTGDPRLGPLQDNGGPTETIALGSGSAAIDAVPASGAGCPATDQRGALRPAGAACDIGAYELARPAATTGSASGPTTTSVTLTGTAFNPDVAPATAYVQYGPSTAYGASSPEQPIAATTTAPVRVVLGGLAPGTTYHYRLVVTNGAPTVFGADRAFTTTAAAPGGSGGAAGGSSAATGRPRIAGLKINPDRFSRHHGATVSYTLTEAATTTFSVLRPLAGRVHGHTCAKPNRANRDGRRCVRWVAIRRSFTHASAAGTARFKLAPGLSAGDYRLQATPRAGALAGNTITAAFAVLAGRPPSREPKARGEAL